MANIDNSELENQIRLTVSPNGNVGIGETLPSAKLHVKGNILLNYIFGIDDERTISIAQRTNATYVTDLRIRSSDDPFAIGGNLFLDGGDGGAGKAGDIILTPGTNFITTGVIKFNYRVNMIKPAPVNNWTCQNVSSDMWMTGFVNNDLSATETSLGAVDFDRYLYIKHDGGGSSKCTMELFLESDILSGSYHSVMRNGSDATSPGNNNTIFAVIPANISFKVFLEWHAGSFNVDCKIYRAGL